MLFTSVSNTLCDLEEYTRIFFPTGPLPCAANDFRAVSGYPVILSLVTCTPAASQTPIVGPETVTPLIIRMVGFVMLVFTEPIVLF